MAIGGSITESSTSGGRRVAGLAGRGSSRRHRIETPEQVALDFELADLGSRFAALALDLLILLAFGLGIVALAALIEWATSGAGVLQGWGTSALLLVGFIAFWGYFTCFEGLRGGQTIGKKWIGLRVIHDGGYPLTLRGSAIRNLVRLIDLQPGVSGLLGGTTMMFHPSTKRLGDLAAETVVVRDRGDGRIPEESWVAAIDRRPPLLDDSQYEVLDRFAARRESLDPDVLERLGQRIAASVADQLNGSAEQGGGSTVERLVALHQEESVRRMGGGDRGRRQAALLLRSQRDSWREYEGLVHRAGTRGLSSLEEGDVSRFAFLYRTVSADLARVRTYGGSGELALALERLVGAGHNLFYRSERKSLGRMVDWLTAGFPRLVRARWTLMTVSAIALFLPGVVSYGAVRADPLLGRDLLGPGFVERAELSVGRLEAGEGYIDVPDMHMPTLSSAVIQNNVQVTFIVFAGGILAGVGSLFVLVLNGIHIGAATAMYDSLGTGELIWGFMAPHAVPELLAIVIAGGAGLYLGSAVIAPGRERRVVALGNRAREAVSLLAGTTMLLILAGLIEGFVSPSGAPPLFRLSVAAAVGSAVLLYIAIAGRGAPDDPITAEGSPPSA